jgi:hypothetical protein
LRNPAAVSKDVLSINFESLDLILAAHVGSAFVEIIPATLNPHHDSDPEGFFKLQQSLSIHGDNNGYPSYCLVLAQNTKFWDPVF